MQTAKCQQNYSHRKATTQGCLAIYRTQQNGAGKQIKPERFRLLEIFNIRGDYRQGLHKKKTLRIVVRNVFMVEVAGVEPASKQGTRKLSTRLAVV